MKEWLHNQAGTLPSLSVPVSQAVVTSPRAKAASTPQRRGPHPPCFEFQTNWKVRTSALHQVFPHYTTATPGWGPPGQPALISTASLPQAAHGAGPSGHGHFQRSLPHKATSLPHRSIVLPTKGPQWLVALLPVSLTPAERPTTDAQSTREKAQGSRGCLNHRLVLLSSGTVQSRKSSCSICVGRVRRQAFNQS